MGRGYKHGLTVYNKQNFTVKQYASEAELLADVCAENTIGFVSTYAMNGWTFAVEEPSYLKNGRVWIKTGNASDYSFNALKEGELMVYPIMVKQNFAGTWRYVPAYAVNQGVWTFWWSGQLTCDGYDFPEVTGGWQGVADAGNTGMNAYAPTITWNSSHISVKQTGYKRRGYISTVNLVDLTRYDQIELVVSQFTKSGSYSEASFEIVDSTGNSMGTQSVTGNGTYTLDISGLTGEYAVRLYMTSATMGSVSMDIYRIVMS